jgi:LysM repeat protein
MPAPVFDWHRIVMVLSLAASSSLLLAGCGSSGGAGLPDGPKWSLADKAPVALGGSGAKSDTAPAVTGPVYTYRGGRNAATGKALDPQTVASGAQPSDGSMAPRVVEVRKGDTLHGLSLGHHVSVKAIMDANKMTTTVIVPGRKLIIPAS